MDMQNRDLILRLVPEEGFDQEKFIIDLANKRPVDMSQCRVYEVNDIVGDFRDAIIEEILKRGWSSFLRRQLLLEKVIAPKQNGDCVAQIMVKFLEVAGVDGELIIVDPYLFAPTEDATYPQLVKTILSPFATQLRLIRVVTLPGRKVNSAVKKSIQAVIRSLNAAIEITHSTSKDYHDRFWISSSRTEGVFVGTSLNGLGKKYALMDRLSKVDVREIVDSLVARRLI